jgi:hypothetical protein
MDAREAAEVSRSHGVGIPITLKCSKCKLEPETNSLGQRTGSVKTGDLVRTGRRRPLYGRARTRGGSRVIHEQHEYRCKKCGFVGWTRHKDILRKPYDQPFHVKLKE